MKKYRIIFIFTALLAATILLSGCTPGNPRFDADNPAGFFWGIWHGWIAPISLVIGIFNDAVRVYETHNTGWFYDLGFYISIISGFGGIALFRKKR